MAYSKEENKKVHWFIRMWRWIKAHTRSNLRVWRVQYTDTAEWTAPIWKEEAKFLAKTHGGVKYIDYANGWW